jgi:hypothetical protein
MPRVTQPTPRARRDCRTSNGLKITQMVAAPPGWWARVPDDREYPGCVTPVACWVVAEDRHGFQLILGFDPTTEGYDEPFHQDVRYFYDPDFQGAEGTSDPGSFHCSCRAIPRPSG